MTSGKIDPGRVVNEAGAAVVSSGTSEAGGKILRTPGKIIGAAVGTRVTGGSDGEVAGAVIGAFIGSLIPGDKDDAIAVQVGREVGKKLISKALKELGGAAEDARGTAVPGATNDCARSGTRCGDLR